MRAAFSCARKLPVPLHALLRRSSPTWAASIRHTTTRHSGNLRCHSSFQRHTPLRGTFYSKAQLRALCLGTLTTAALALTVTQQGVDAEAEAPPRAAEKTTEELMLAESERERRARLAPDGDLSLILQLFRRTQLFVIDYIIEPLATGFRFVTLVAIFAPVILTVPLIYVGERVSNKSDERTGTLWWYGFLVASLERAGPTFIKLGQWAASRTDIFPTELCDRMSKLHSNAKAHPLWETERIVRQAFDGRSFEDIFEEFYEKPLGVGAIAQVYKAKMKPDLLPPTGKKDKNFRRALLDKVEGLVKRSPGQGPPSAYVAVKVLHPRVDKIVNRDLRIMRFFAVLLNMVPTLEWLSFPDEVDTFSYMMRLQMDLRIEAENLAKFRNNFKHRTTVTFPAPYREYTTRDVLVEEFVDGVPLSLFLENGGGPYQEAMANMGLDAFLHMLVMDNFIHSDLHPGNIMIRFLKPPTPLPLLARIPFFSSAPLIPAKSDQEDGTAEVRSRLLPYRGNRSAWERELDKLEAEGYRPQLVFIDTGLVTELNATNRRNFLDLFRAIAEFDGYRAGKLMISRSRSPDSVIDGEGFALKMQHLVLTVKSRTLALGNISFGDILSEVLQMVRQHHVRMEGDFVNVVISMLLLEGIGRALDPKMDLLKSSLPMLRSVGAGAAMHATTTAKQTNGGGTLSLLKVWLAIETRQFVTSSIEIIEDCVKYDQLSPNI